MIDEKKIIIPGTTATLVIELCDILIDTINSAVFTINKSNHEETPTLQKDYPGDDVSIIDETIYILLNQEETLLFEPDCLYIEGQLNFTNNTVGKTETVTYSVGRTQATTIIEGNTASISYTNVIKMTVASRNYILASMQEIIDNVALSQTAAVEAETARDESVAAKDTAVTQASDAATSASNASTSEANAQTAANQAETARNESVTAKNTAVEKADEAATSANNASTSEANAVAAKDIAVAQASAATTSANNASASESNLQAAADEAGMARDESVAAKDTAVQKADSAALSEANAKVSETNAKTSETVTAQAMTDYLAMLGVDVATLIDGKIPMAQIPATATQEIYTVTSETELTGLIAQRGDLAELIETVDDEQTITKTWQCLGDPTVRDNWVVWGTSYAVQAGNATTATNAENSARINNHRLVEISESDWETAVKDPDTYYLVY